MESALLTYLSNFTPITDSLQTAIKETTIFRQYDKGDVLLKEGSRVYECYFVIQGCIRSYVFDKGEEITLEFYTENQSLVPPNYGMNQPSKINFECLENTIVSVGNPELEEKSFSKFPELKSLSLKIAEQQLSQQQENFTLYKHSTPEKRYLALQRSRPRLLQIVPQYQIASYLGIKPESLSRIRKRIADKKSIS